MRVYRGDAGDLRQLAGQTIAVVGYGNQGRAHALNLRDSGIQVVLGLRPGRPSWARAEADAFAPRPVAAAVADADLVALLLPDEEQPAVYAADVSPALRPAAALVFAHGFALRYGLIVPPPGVDVLLVAPIGPGTEVRARFQAGEGIPAYVAVGGAVTDRAWPRCLAYAAAIGCLRAAAFETTIAAETEVDLFGEQSVLCGGLSALLASAFDVLVESGYDPEMAYLECVHQVSLLAGLIRDHGIDGMRARISKTALFGDLTRGPRVVGEASRAAMREALQEVRDGSFAAEWTASDAADRLQRLRAAADARPIEATGHTVRRLVRGESA